MAKSPLLAAIPLWMSFGSAGELGYFEKCFWSSDIALDGLGSEGVLVIRIRRNWRLVYQTEAVPLKNKLPYITRVTMSFIFNWSPFCCAENAWSWSSQARFCVTERFSSIYLVYVRVLWKEKLTPCPSLFVLMASSYRSWETRFHARPASIKGNHCHKS